MHQINQSSLNIDNNNNCDNAHNKDSLKESQTVNFGLDWGQTTADSRNGQVESKRDRDSVLTGKNKIDLHQKDDTQFRTSS